MTETADSQASQVVHNVPEERFELHVVDLLCLVNYRCLPDILVIYHTEVPQQLEGRGLAARLTQAALAYARAENLQVDPRCPYTAAFFQKHPEFADLLVPR